LGFAGGNNVGIKYALENKADYILVLNNDTTVDKNLLVRLVEVAKKKKRFGILSPKIYFAKGFEFYKERYKKSELGKVIWSAGGIIDWKNVYVNNRGIDEVDVGQYDKVEKIEFATGAAMFLEAKVLKKVGLFDKKYFLYLEDADLSQRMLRCGFEIYYVPKAIVYHKVGKTAGIGSNLADYFLTRNRLLFTIKYAPLRSKIAVFMESIRFCFNGRRWQRLGVRDFYLGKFGKGSYR
jgi:GT2 family glycosyltransferase